MEGNVSSSVKQLTDLIGQPKQSVREDALHLAKPLTTLMAQMKANYPSQELLPETAAVWLEMWKDMSLEWGLDDFRRALKRCNRLKLFMPQPADIEAEHAVLRQEQMQRKRSSAASSRFQACEECTCYCDSSTGLVQKINPATKGTYVEHCDCWKIWNRDRIPGVQAE